jgi:hypothetical protein
VSSLVQCLVRLPEASGVRPRTLPKNKIYEHSGANTRLKDLFVKQVEQIVWRYKLAPETINLAAKTRRAGDSGLRDPTEDARTAP